ncbi:MAG TPA: hypothetical protein VGD07_14145 [Methylomirabilota bacterium]|jgi:hypothetical protein
MVRVRAPTSSRRPSASWRITTRLASQARRYRVLFDARDAALGFRVARTLRE